MELRYSIEQLTDALDGVERRRWLFAHLPLDPQHRVWLRQRAWVRTVHSTTRIEGNTLSDLEVDRLLDGLGARNLPRKDALEVLGSRSALELVDELATQPDIDLDQTVIREIHRRVLDGQSNLLTPGQYRRGENRVVDADGEVVFVTPPSGDVPELMRALVTWVAAHGEVPAPILAALVHLELVAIHPFDDGNGRTARALSRLVLARGGFGFDGLVALDAELDRRRVDYFAAIRSSIGRGYEPGYDATPFVEMFLKAVTVAADHVLAMLRGIGEVQIAVRREVVEGRLAAGMLDALVFAYINRSVRAGDYQRLTGRTAPSTSRDLAVAASMGYLLPEGTTRDRWYRLGPRLTDLGDQVDVGDPRDG